MITKDQLIHICGGNYNAEITAILTRAYTPRRLEYGLPKGTLVYIAVSPSWPDGILWINGEMVDDCFPYDAAELLE